MSKSIKELLGFTPPKVTAEALETQSQRGRSFLKPNFVVFKPKDGDNRIRILPPTWAEAKTFMFDFHRHEAKNGFPIICAHTFGSTDEVCAASATLASTGDDEASRMFRAKKRFAVFVIDRNNEDAGPLVWVIPAKLLDDLLIQLNPDDGGLIDLTDLDEGYDVSFRRQGTGRTTKYAGLMVARKPSPLHSNIDKATKWMKKIMENPLNTVFMRPTKADYMEFLSANGYSGGSMKINMDNAEELSDSAETIITDNKIPEIPDDLDDEVPF